MIYTAKSDFEPLPRDSNHSVQVCRTLRCFTLHENPDLFGNPQNTPLSWMNPRILPHTCGNRKTSRYNVVGEASLCYNVTVNDAAWMHEALVEAELALSHDDVPIGAVVVLDNEIIGRGHNRREANADPTAHAEIVALREAADALGSWRLSGVTVYCTLEPCPMCAGAMVLARVPRLVYGADDPKAGAAGSVVELLRDPRFNHQVTVTRGVMTEECQKLLDRFFSKLRQR